MSTDPRLTVEGIAAAIPDPFNFTILWEARSRALELAGRLQSGDLTALPDARTILAAHDVRQAAATAALRAAGVTGIAAYDSVNMMLFHCTGVDALDLQVGLIEGYHELPA